MITEIRQSRTRLLHYYERHPRRRHHTLDNATLDKFKFICIPLHLDKTCINPSSTSSSQSNLPIITSNDFSNLKSVGLSSPTRRVRFKFDEHDKNENNDDQYTRSSDDIRLPKTYSTHRVEFQIPIHQDINPWLNVDCSISSSIPAKTRSLTKQKIDINYNINNNKAMHLQDMTSSIDFPTSSTIDSNKIQSQWYKEMYNQVHKQPENKKASRIRKNLKHNLDVILVKLPPTPSRYREYYQKKDEQQNPYKPTYIFPEEFDDDLERMEDYIRKAASQNIDDNHIEDRSSSSIRTSTINTKDHQTIPKRNIEKIIRFDDQLPPSIPSSSIERIKSNNDALTSPVTVNQKSNANHIQPSSTTDNEQKLIYKRILRGGEIPSAGLQKFSVNNRGKHMVLFLYE